jgi:YD repeat-containing protein
MISYTYDDRGRRTSMTLPAGEVAYRYDAIGRLSEVEDWLGGVHEYTYDAASQLMSVERPNGISTTVCRLADRSA